MGPELAGDDYCALVPRFDAAALLPSFAELDAHPELLHRAVAGTLERDRLRLGAYFEDLVQFFVEHMAGHQDVVTGVVVSENKRTVGELDMLFRDGESCHHWELAVKFYLQVPDLAPDPGECFVGPETRDRLHFKMGRLRDHQVPMAKHAAAVEALAPWQPLQSAAFLRGRLFYPASSDWNQGFGGTSVAANHQRGWWCPVDRTEELLPQADSYAVLTRRDWFAPVDAAWDAITPLTREQVGAWASEAATTWEAGVTRTHVIAGLGPDGREVHRGFAVSIGWPGLDASGD